MQRLFSRGIWYMIGAAFFFSLMSVTVKATGQRIPSQELVLARSLFIFITTGILIYRRHFPFWGRNKPILFLRGLFGFLALSAFFYTLTTIPIAYSVVIQYTSPLFTAFLAPFILKEPNTPRQWVLLFIAFLGVVFIAKPGQSVAYLPVVVGLFGAFSAGIAYNLVRKLRSTEHPLNIILYLPAVSIPLTLPSVCNHFVLPMGLEWLGLLLIGFFTFVAQVFLTKGLHLEKAARATNVSYLMIVFSTLFGMLIWHEIPDLWALLGMFLIVAALLGVSRGQ